MLLLSSITANIAFASGAAIVSFFLIRRSRRYLAHTHNESATINDPLAELGPVSKDAPNAFAPVSIEARSDQMALHETARDLMGRLDSKMSALQAIIRVANEATTRLESAVARAEKIREELADRSSG